MEFQFKLSAENLKTIVYVHLCKCQKQGTKSGFRMAWIKKHASEGMTEEKQPGKLRGGRLLVGT